MPVRKLLIGAVLDFNVFMSGHSQSTLGNVSPS